VNQQLRRDLARQEQENEALRKQLARLQGFGSERLANLVCVERIQFGRYTLAFDEDKDGWDDGVNVYLQLRDNEGDKIKAAGQVDIELWDLAAEQGKRLLLQRRYGLAELREYWLSGVLADHYKFKLPWSESSTPGHGELTVKLRFDEALTGRSFEIQTLVKVSVRQAN